MLGEVRVLILVDHHEAEEFLIVPTNVVKVPQQDIHIEQYVVEVHRVRTPASVDIVAEDTPCLWSLGPFVFEIVGRIVLILLGIHESILGV